MSGWIRCKIETLRLSRRLSGHSDAASHRQFLRWLARVAVLALLSLVFVFGSNVGSQTWLRPQVMAAVVSTLGAVAVGLISLFGVVYKLRTESKKKLQTEIDSLALELRLVSKSVASVGSWMNRWAVDDQRLEYETYHRFRPAAPLVLLAALPRIGDFPASIALALIEFAHALDAAIRLADALPRPQWESEAVTKFRPLTSAQEKVLAQAWQRAALKAGHALTHLQELTSIRRQSDAAIADALLPGNLQRVAAGEWLSASPWNSGFEK